MEIANAGTMTAPLGAVPSMVAAPQPFSATAPIPLVGEAATVAKAEPTAQQPEPAEPRYVVDSGVTDEELARSIKSINEFSVELERMRERMQKRQPRY